MLFLLFSVQLSHTHITTQAVLGSAMGLGAGSAGAPGVLDAPGARG